MRTPRAAVFDLDDTLAAERELVDETFAELAADVAGRLREPTALPGHIVEEARRLWWAHPDHPWARRTGVASWEALWARFEGDDPVVAGYRDWAPRYRLDAWRNALRRQGVDDPALAADLADRFPALRRTKHRVDPDAAPLLDELRARGVRLGLVTNGLSCLQREKLAATGLADRFEAVVAGADLGVGKPDPAPLRAVLERLGAPAGDAVMIGNSVEKDVACAAAAGVRAIWVDRTGSPDVEDGPAPDAAVRGLAELREVLGLTSS